MSSAQLQSIFHVDSQELVPHYEVIKLIHHGTSHHNIKKRSVNTIETNEKPSTKSFTHHVKKDLSKSAYYSAVKNVLLLQNFTTNSLINNTKTLIDDISSNNNNNNNYNSFSGNSDDSDNSNYINNSGNRKKIDLSNIKEHNVSLSAFGDVYNLTLRPTDGLFKDGPQFLKMWNVQSDPNATQGLLYDEILEVGIIILIILHNKKSWYKYKQPQFF